jgi:hypothetical protein
VFRSESALAFVLRLRRYKKCGRYRTHPLPEGYVVKEGYGGEADWGTPFTTTFMY